MEPLFSQKSKRGIKDTLQILYSLPQGIAVKHILRESTPSRVTVMAVTQMLEFIIAMAHDMRFDAAEGMVVFMQKDETCASKIKRMGCGKGKRVRRDGSSWYHTLVNCDQVLDTTGGAAASKYLSREWRHGVVNHKKEWVAATGVHTNTVEAANSSFNKELKSRGGRLGNAEDVRTNRMKLFAELANGSLTVNGNSRIRRIFQDIRMICAQVCFFRDDEEETDESDATPSRIVSSRIVHVSNTHILLH